MRVQARAHDAKPNQKAGQRNSATLNPYAMDYATAGGENRVSPCVTRGSNRESGTDQWWGFMWASGTHLFGYEQFLRRITVNSICGLATIVKLNVNKWLNVEEPLS